MVILLFAPEARYSILLWRKTLQDSLRCHRINRQQAPQGMQQGIKGRAGVSLVCMRAPKAMQQEIKGMQQGTRDVQQGIRGMQQGIQGIQ